MLKSTDIELDIACSTIVYLLKLIISFGVKQGSTIGHKDGIALYCNN